MPICLIPNCQNQAPPDAPFCIEHWDIEGCDLPSRSAGIGWGTAVLGVMLCVFGLVVGFAFHLSIAHPGWVTGMDCPAVRDLIDWLAP